MTENFATGSSNPRTSSAANAKASDLKIAADRPKVRRPGASIWRMSVTTVESAFEMNDIRPAQQQKSNFSVPLKPERVSIWPD